MKRTELTAQLIDQIALDVRAGNFMEPSARRHGVGHSTLHKWLARGRELMREIDEPAGDDEVADPDGSTARDRLCVDLVDALEKAEAEAEVRVVAIVQNAIPTNWTAGFRWLESRARSRWLRIERAELTGRDGGPVVTEDATKKVLAEADRISKRLLGLSDDISPAEVEAARNAYWNQTEEASRSH